MANKTKLHVLHSLNVKMFQLNYLISCNDQHHPGGGSHSEVSQRILDDDADDAASCVSSITLGSGSIISSDKSWIEATVVGSVTLDITSCSSDNVSLMNGDASAFKADTLLILSEATLSVSSHLAISGESWILEALVCRRVTAGDMAQTGRGSTSCASVVVETVGASALFSVTQTFTAVTDSGVSVWSEC